LNIKYHYNIEQGTDAWHELRRGIVTASVVSKLITPTGKIANNETVRQMAYRVAGERITGRNTPSAKHENFDRGHIEEAFARDLYAQHYAPVTQCGFIETDRLGFRMGYSPDGLVGEDGLIEIKSRLAKFQVETFLTGGVPSEYILQCHFALIVSGREWLDFVSYSNGMALYRSRVTLDGVDTEVILEAVSLFEARVMGIIGDYTEATEGRPVAEYRDIQSTMEVDFEDN